MCPHTYIKFKFFTTLSVISVCLGANKTLPRHSGLLWKWSFPFGTVHSMRAKLPEAKNLHLLFLPLRSCFYPLMSPPPLMLFKIKYFMYFFVFETITQIHNKIRSYLLYLSPTIPQSIPYVPCNTSPSKLHVFLF